MRHRCECGIWLSVCRITARNHAMAPIEATFDGSVFRPKQPVELPPNTPVRLTIEDLRAAPEAGAFLRTARSLNLEGPSDWAAKLDEHLYGEGTRGEQ